MRRLATKQRGASQAQLAYRARVYSLCPACSWPCSTHTKVQLLHCAIRVQQ